MKKRFLFYFILVMLFLVGCSKNKAMSVYEYRTTGEDILSDLYLVRTEYYSDKVVIYWDGNVSSLDGWSFSDDFEVNKNVLILNTDNPEAFNSFSVNYGDASYYFRYLDSEQYACLCTLMDSEGGLNYSGSPDRYYTDEEIEEQNENTKQQEEKEDELFEKLEGTWECEDGDYIRIYKDEDYAIEYMLNGEQGQASPVYLDEYLRADVKITEISYIDGPYEVALDIILSEDGSSFEYCNKNFFL